MIAILRNKYFLAGIMCCLVFLVLHVHLYNTYKVSGTDNLENLAGAFSIAKYNTYTVYSADLKLRPSAAREPLFPFMLGMLIKAKHYLRPHFNDVVSLPMIDMYARAYRLLDDPSITTNKYIATMGIPCSLNIVLLFITILLTTFFVYLRTKNFYLVLYAPLTLIFSAALAESAHTFLTEILAALLCTLVGIFLYYSKDNFLNKHFPLFFGITVSLLILTKAIFLYFLPIIFIYLAALYFKDIKNKNKIFYKNILIFLGIILVIVGGWMIRNHIHFHRYFIADRKGQMLMYRAEFDAISNKEYPYLFVLYTPGLSKYFLKDENKQDWVRLYNKDGNEPIIIDTYRYIYTPFFTQKKMSIRGAYGQPDSNNQRGYKELENISMGKMLNHPLGHLKLTMAFLYRCIFLEDGTGLQYLGIKLPHESSFEQRIDSFTLALLINVPIWLMFFYLLILAVKNKEIENIGLILVPLYSIFMYSFFAFSHPRYMIPLIPLLTIIFCIGMKKLVPVLRNAYALKPTNVSIPNLQ